LGEKARCLSHVERCRNDVASRGSPSIWVARGSTEASTGGAVVAAAAKLVPSSRASWMRLGLPDAAAAQVLGSRV